VGSVPVVPVAVLLEQCLAPVPGGTGRYSRELAAALAATAPDGAEVQGWVAWHRDTAAAAVPAVRGPQRLPLPRRALVAAYERGIGPAPTGADVVHAPTLLVPPRRGRPLVVTIHDAVPWSHPQTLTPRGVRWHRRMAERAARTADLVIVPTQAVAAELGPILALGDRVRVVGEGVSGALALPADAEARAARLGLPERYLLTLATLEPRKGLAELVAALAEPAAPDLPLLVVGQPGWGGVDPSALAAAAGLPADRFRVLGRLPDADLAVALARATALVVPSHAEGFGLPLLEGMAAGVPVLTSTAPALVEVAGGAALSSGLGPSELAEALRRIVEDELLRRDLVVAGLRRAADFSWERAATTLWAAYADLPGSTAGPA